MTYNYFTIRAEAGRFLEAKLAEGFVGYVLKFSATQYEVRYW